MKVLNFEYESIQSTGTSLDAGLGKVQEMFDEYIAYLAI